MTFARGTPRLEDALLGSHIELRDDLVLAGLSEAEWRRRAPLPGSVTLDFVKMRLARLDIPMGTGAWVPALVDGCDSPERVEALAAFFLARVIDRSCRWVTAERQDLLKERAPLWSFSIGVPVKYANSLALGRFRRVLGIAATWARRGVPESTTLAGACSAVRDLERVRWTTDVSVQAEIAAAVRSFITSPRALEGIYLYFDVGAGTLDGASFRFHRPPDKPSQVNFYSGEVEHLGVAAVAGVVAAATSLAVAEVERILAEPHSRDNLSGLLDDAERQIQNLIVKVIMCSKRVDGKEWRKGLDDLAQAYHRRRHANPAGPIPLFVGGGGSGSSFFRSAILSTYDERSLGNAGVRRYSLEEVPLPDDLDMSGMASEHFRRFAVAYGLSIPPEEGPDVDLPPPECEPPRRTPEPPVTDYQDLP
ncbi:MAG: hypothetical protein HYY95_25315 [Candidatus Rokubacteria bacterium]|nr:hypothetical protein [Candidatus Rokubacteria bacterium]MBI3108851.1 hypothetical protein [Candidatus Rokubacteria bacterium]